MIVWCCDYCADLLGIKPQWTNRSRGPHRCQTCNRMKLYCFPRMQMVKA